MPDGVFVTVIKAFILVNGLMAFFAFMTVFERKLIGRMQTRHGPNRVGPMGLLQPIADLGKLIRKLRIDELPQTWSVLMGRMSFVGPRPEVPAFVDDLEDKLPFYAERHMVKPGITGWAQINYPYGASIEDARAKLEYDLYYAKNYTPFLDLLIMLQTLRVILWPEGAR